jgi:uncharacterized protein (DUF433 family)
MGLYLSGKCRGFGSYLKPVIKGTRIAVDLVLEELSHYPDIHELLAAHPALTREDVQACLAYAQALVTSEEVSPALPKERVKTRGKAVTSDDALFRLIGIGKSGIRGGVSGKKHTYLARSSRPH